MDETPSSASSRVNVNAIPIQIRNQITVALKDRIAAGEMKGEVTINNPDCISYPCQCQAETYCCLCMNGYCTSICQNGCEQITYLVCMTSDGETCP